MAQVKIKKFADGGKFELDGKLYSIDDVRTAFSKLSQKDGDMLYPILTSLQSGKTLSGNQTAGNVLSSDVSKEIITNVFGDYEKGKARLQNTANNQLRKDLGATLGSKADSLRRALASFYRNLSTPTPDLNLNIEVEPEEVKQEKKSKLKSGSGWWERDKDNKLMDTVENHNRTIALDEMLNYFTGTDEDRAKYDGWDNGDTTPVLNWFKGHNTDAKEIFATIRNKIISGEELTETEKSLMRSLGFEPTVKEDVDDAGVVTLLPGISNDDANRYFTIDGTTGNVTLNDQFYSDLASLGVKKGGNYWFNDKFFSLFNENPALLKRYKWLRNKFLIDGKFYNYDPATGKGDKDLLNFLHNPGGFYELNKNFRYKDSNAIIKWLWGINDDDLPIPVSQAGDSRFKDARGVFFSTIYDKPNGDGSISDVIQYINEDEDVDPFVGTRPMRYVELTDDGPVVIDNFTPIVSENPRGIRMRTTNDRNSKYYNTYKEDLVVGSDSNKFNITYYVPFLGDDAGRFVYVKFPTSDVSSEGISTEFDGKNIKLPLNIWSMINKDSFWKTLANNDELREKFYKTMSAYITRGKFVSRILNKRELQDLGLSKEDASVFMDWITQFAKGTSLDNGLFDAPGGSVGITNLGTAVRNIGRVGVGLGPRLLQNNTIYNDNLIEDYKIPSNKNGGEIPTFQTGGNFGTNTKPKSWTEIVSNYESGKEADVIFDSKSHKTSADRLELASILLDLAAVPATFVAGAGNVVGGVGGAAADVLQFVSDIKRDGFQGSDLIPLGAGLAMDAVTLAPIVGTGSASAKLAMKMIKHAKTLRNFFYGIGAISAANAVRNIAQDGNVDMDDLRTITMAVQGFFGGANMGKILKNRNALLDAIGDAVKNGSRPIKVKIGNLEKKADMLSDTLIAEIKKTRNVEDAASKIRSELISQQGFSADELKDIKAESLLESFGISVKNNKIGSGKHVDSGEQRFKLFKESKKSQEFDNAVKQLGKESVRSTLNEKGMLDNPVYKTILYNTGINTPEIKLAARNANVYKGRQVNVVEPYQKPINEPVRLALPPSRFTTLSNQGSAILSSGAPITYNYSRPSLRLPAGAETQVLPARTEALALPARKVLLLPTWEEPKALPKITYLSPTTTTTTYTQGTLFKKGGKIVKGKRGVADIVKDAVNGKFLIDVDEKIEEQPETENKNWWDTLSGIHVKVNRDDLSENPSFGEFGDRKVYNTDDKSVPIETNTISISHAGNPFNVDPKDVLDFNRFVTAAAFNREKYERLQREQDALRRQKVVGYDIKMPTGPTITPLYKAAKVANNVIDNPPQYSDSKLDAAIRLTQDQQRRDVMEEANDKFSASIDKYNTDLANAQTKQNEINATVANKNNELETKIDAEKHRLDAAKISDLYQYILGPYLNDRDRSMINRYEEANRVHAAADLAKLRREQRAYKDILVMNLFNTNPALKSKFSEENPGNHSSVEMEIWLQKNYPDHYNKLIELATTKYNEAEYQTSWYDKRVPLILQPYLNWMNKQNENN